MLQTSPRDMFSCYMPLKGQKELIKESRRSHIKQQQHVDGCNSSPRSSCDFSLNTNRIPVPKPTSAPALSYLNKTPQDTLDGGWHSPQKFFSHAHAHKHMGKNFDATQTRRPSEANTTKQVSICDQVGLSKNQFFNVNTIRFRRARWQKQAETALAQLQLTK